MPDYRRMYDSDYLANWDLDGDTVVEIVKVAAGEIGGHQGSEKQRKPIVYLKGAKKAWIMPKTCGKIVAGMYGNDTSKWVGKKITLYVGSCDAFGQTVSCIRVRPEVPK